MAKLPEHIISLDYSMCKFLWIKSVAWLSTINPRPPKWDALPIPSVEQARENLGHEDVMSNHLSQEVHGQIA